MSDGISEAVGADHRDKGVKCERCQLVTPPDKLGHVCGNPEPTPKYRWFEEGKAYATIMSGLVIRWKFKRSDGEISASRDAVMVAGVIEIMNASQGQEFNDIMKEAREVQQELEKDHLFSSTHRDAVAKRYQRASLVDDINSYDPGP